MTITVSTLAWMVGIAVAITVLAPLVLMVLWIKDWIKGTLW